ncbi:MAG TPA: metalloregulator ArsR/SmtB family transcription factor, partial [Bryobacteraceae bacterium]|nr:metalloregulator ArsR/SmtB family transcription factor [Bryobacteraceae bacterium]
MKGSLLKALRLLGDENRLRMLRLLAQEELSVAELQEILGLGQSRISMALAQMKQADLVELRRAGQKSLYQVAESLPDLIRQVLTESAAQIPATRQDDRALSIVLGKRKDRLRDYFDELAGRFGRD